MSPPQVAAPPPPPVSPVNVTPGVIEDQPAFKYIEDQPGVNDYLGPVIVAAVIVLIAIIGGMLSRYKRLRNLQKSTLSEKDRQDDEDKLQKKQETTLPTYRVSQVDNTMQKATDHLAKVRNSLGSGNPELVQGSMGSMSSNSNCDSSSNEHDMEFGNHAPLSPNDGEYEYYV